MFSPSIQSYELTQNNASKVRIKNTAPQFGKSISPYPSVIPELPNRSLADTFFKLPELVDGYFDKNWLSKHQPTIKKIIGRPLKTVVSAFSDHDYKDMFSIKGLGRSGIIPPLGAIATIVIPVTLLGRLYCSYKRSSNLDKREIGDVLRRDLPTLVILVYMLGPIVKAMSHMMQNNWGLQLMSHLKDVPGKKASNLAKLEAAIKSTASPLGYTQLGRYYTLNSPKRLAEILSAPFNHVGINKALQKFKGNKSLSTAQKRVLNQFSLSLKTVMRESRKGTLSVESGTMKTLFEQLTKFDTLSAQASVKNPLQLRNFITNYAKGARHISSFTGLAIIVGLLGFGVTKFNEWWAHFQYGRLYRKQGEQIRNQIPAE